MANGRSLRPRDHLPYREKTEVYLRHGAKVLAQDRKRFVMFPGGGVEAGETNLGASAKREVLEEVGATVDGMLQRVITVEWDWFPEWADTATRKLRYAQFRGERVHILVGRVKAIGTSTSAESDVWSSSKEMPLAACMRLVRKYGATDHPNTRPYRIAQEMALQVLHLMGGAPRPLPG
jgi:8-oxo-dGTP pyrophosphatase MutT (NUDIX family)